MWPFNRKKKEKKQAPPLKSNYSYGGYLGSRSASPAPSSTGDDSVINTMAAFTVFNSMANDDSCRHDHHHSSSHDHHSSDFSSGGGSFDGGGSSGGWDSGGSCDSGSSSSSD